MQILVGRAVLTCSRDIDGHDNGCERHALAYLSRLQFITPEHDCIVNSGCDFNQTASRDCQDLYELIIHAISNTSTSIADDSPLHEDQVYEPHLFLSNADPPLASAPVQPTGLSSSLDTTVEETVPNINLPSCSPKRRDLAYRRDLPLTSTETSSHHNIQNCQPVTRHADFRWDQRLRPSFNYRPLDRQAAEHPEFLL